MASRAIVCVGNSLLPEDDLGGRVFRRLGEMALPADMDIIDGGLCGIDLIRVVEGRRRVVFADTIRGLPTPDAVATLTGDEVAARASSFGHDAGLPYLLRLMPAVCVPPPPETAVVGADCDASEETVRRVAERCLEIAIHGLS